MLVLTKDRGTQIYTFQLTRHVLTSQVQAHLLSVAYFHRRINSIRLKGSYFYFLSCLEIFKACKPEQSLE